LKLTNLDDTLCKCFKKHNLILLIFTCSSLEDWNFSMLNKRTGRIFQSII
jgi:hypothetical protein